MRAAARAHQGFCGTAACDRTKSLQGILGDETVSEPLLIKHNVHFLRRVMGSGGKNLKKCMQCGTCSVVCSLAPAEPTFPRRQMLEAQWGLSDRLASDPAVWLCHNCGDC